MAPIWKLAPGSTPPLDSTAVLEVAWRFWSRLQERFGVRLQPFDSLERPSIPRGVAEARLLMRGYDDAAGWWRNAVQWLMTERWIATPAGDRSPEQLVSAFWGSERLTLPWISFEHFGSAQAVPLPSVAPILGRLIRPANAIAGDWLRQRMAADAGLDDVIELAAWRTLDWGEPFRVVVSGRSRYLTSPAVEARSHGGDLLGTFDRIRIEPGIPPLLAVATLTHEWQHLILTGRRLQGTAPGVHENTDEIRLLEEDPWLAEGAAEWATDVILAPCRQQAPGAAGHLAGPPFRDPDPNQRRSARTWLSFSSCRGCAGR